MTGYLGIFLLAWFLGWAFFIVLSLYALYRIALYYAWPERAAKYWRHVRTFEEALALE